MLLFQVWYYSRVILIAHVMEVRWEMQNVILQNLFKY